MLMCIQNLVRFCQFIFKILSGNQIFTDSRNHGKTESWKDGITEGQGESSIAPLFQSGAINIYIYIYTVNSEILAKILFFLVFANIH